MPRKRADENAKKLIRKNEKEKKNTRSEEEMDLGVENNVEVDEEDDEDFDEDQALNLLQPSGKYVRAYRAEVERYHKNFSHVDMGMVPDERTGANVKIGEPHIYNPPPKEEYISYEGFGENFKCTFKPGKKTPPKNEDLYKFGQDFLAGREKQLQGIMSWINFGDAKRALDFGQQKASNPNEQEKNNQYVVKSFKVPADIFKVIAENAVHEDHAKTYPTRPINVDRQAPNQLGLRQQHIDLINRTFIRDTERVETLEELKKRIDNGELSDSEKLSDQRILPKGSRATVKKKEKKKNQENSARNKKLREATPNPASADIQLIDALPRQEPGSHQADADRSSDMPITAGPSHMSNEQAFSYEQQCILSAALEENDVLADFNAESTTELIIEPSQQTPVSVQEAADRINPLLKEFDLSVPDYLLNMVRPEHLSTVESQRKAGEIEKQKLNVQRQGWIAQRGAAIQQSVQQRNDHIDELKAQLEQHSGIIKKLSLRYFRLKYEKHKEKGELKHLNRVMESVPSVGRREYHRQEFKLIQKEKKVLDTSLLYQGLFVEDKLADQEQIKEILSAQTARDLVKKSVKNSIDSWGDINKEKAVKDATAVLLELVVKSPFFKSKMQKINQSFENQKKIQEKKEQVETLTNLPKQPSALTTTDAKQMAQQEVKQKVEVTARDQAQKEASRQGEEVARRKILEEADRLAKEEVRQQAVEETRRQAEEAARRQIEELEVRIRNLRSDDVKQSASDRTPDAAQRVPRKARAPREAEALTSEGKPETVWLP